MLSLGRLAAAAIMATGSTAAMAQSGNDDVVKIERAVAKYAKTLYVNKRLGLDLGILPGITGSPPKATYRTTMHQQNLASDAGATLVSMSEVVRCATPTDPHSCTTRDVKAVLRIGVPRVEGDSATVWLYVSDSSPGGLTPISSSDRQLLVVRDGNGWRVLRALQRRES